MSVLQGFVTIPLIGCGEISGFEFMVDGLCVQEISLWTKKLEPGLYINPQAIHSGISPIPIPVRACPACGERVNKAALSGIYDYHQEEVPGSVTRLYLVDQKGTRVHTGPSNVIKVDGEEASSE